MTGEPTYHSDGQPMRVAALPEPPRPQGAPAELIRTTVPRDGPRSIAEAKYASRWLGRWAAAHKKRRKPWTLQSCARVPWASTV